MSSGTQTSTPSTASTMLLEAAEVDDDVVVDAHPGGLLELLDRAGRSAVGVGGVPHHVGAAGDGVAVLGSCSRDGRPASRAGWRRRTPTRRSAERWNRSVVSDPPPASWSMPQPSQSRESEPITRMLIGCLGAWMWTLSGRFVELVGDVDDVEVAVEVAVEEGHREPAHHAQRQQRRQQHLRHRVRPAGPSAALPGLIWGRQLGLGRVLRSVGHRHLHMGRCLTDEEGECARGYALVRARLRV